MAIEFFFVAKQIEIYNVPQCSHAIFPGALFSLEIISREIGNWEFHDAQFKACDFGGDFGFKAKAFAFKNDVLNDFALEEFVTGFHVGEVKA